jgi:hypothetical protein
MVKADLFRELFRTVVACAVGQAAGGAGYGRPRKDQPAAPARGACRVTAVRVDGSVWVDHFHRHNDRLATWLLQDAALIHTLGAG